MNRAEEVKQKIAGAHADVQRLDSRIARLITEIGTALASEPPDETAADAIQQTRDVSVRAKERATLRLAALIRELPAAEKADAEARLVEIAAAEGLVEPHAAALAAYEKLFRELEAAIPEAYAAIAKRRALSQEASYWAARCRLDVPGLPRLASPVEPRQLNRLMIAAQRGYEAEFNPSGGYWSEQLRELNKRAA